MNQEKAREGCKSGSFRRGPICDLPPASFLKSVPFAFAVKRTGIDSQQNGRFLNGGRDGEQPADVLGFELFQRNRVADL